MLEAPLLLVDGGPRERAGAHRRARPAQAQSTASSLSGRLTQHSKIKGPSCPCQDWWPLLLKEVSLMVALSLQRQNYTTTLKMKLLHPWIFLGIWQSMLQGREFTCREAHRMGSACAVAARRMESGGGACRRMGTCACSGPALGSASCGAEGCAHNTAISAGIWRIWTSCRGQTAHVLLQL